MITVPYWWHTSLLELLWLLGGVTALPLAYRNLVDAVKDQEILDELRDDPTVHSRHYFMVEEAAKGRSFDHWLTVVSAVAIVVAGIIGCAVPNPTAGATSATGFAITGALLTISAVTAARALSSTLRRKRMYELAAGRSAVIAAAMRARQLQEATEKERDA